MHRYIRRGAHTRTCGDGCTLVIFLFFSVGHGFINVWMHGCMSECVVVCVCQAVGAALRMRVCACVCACVYVYVHVYMCMCMCICIYVCVCVHAHYSLHALTYRQELSLPSFSPARMRVCVAGDESPLLTY